MAEPVPISGGPEEAKIRSLWGVALLPLVTFGIYSLVWYYKINREMADLGRKRQVPDLGDSPGKSLLAVTLGALVVVPAIMSFIGTYKRIKLAQQVVGVRENDQANGWLVLILMLLGLSIVAYAYMQDGLNKVWNIDSGRVPAGMPAGGQIAYQVPPAAPAAPAAPAPPAAPAAAPPPPPPPPPPAT